MNLLDPFLLPILQLLTTIYLYFVFLALLFQYLFQRKSLDDITHSFIEYIFLPVKSSVEKSSLKGFISHFSIVLLLSCVIAGIPPLRDYVIAHLFSKEFLAILKNHNEFLSSWFDFFDILLAVLILITFGGLIFTDFVANRFKDICSRYQTDIQNLLDGELFRSEQKVRTSIEAYLHLSNSHPSKNLGANNQNPLNAIKTYTSHINHLLNISFSLQNHLLRDIPKNYRNYLVIIFYSNFPGGLYGLIIFSLFIVGIVFKVFKLYLASPLLK